MLSSPVDCGAPVGGATTRARVDQAASGRLPIRACLPALLGLYRPHARVCQLGFIFTLHYYVCQIMIIFSAMVIEKPQSLSRRAPLETPPSQQIVYLLENARQLKPWSPHVASQFSSQALMVCYEWMALFLQWSVQAVTAACVCSAPVPQSRGSGRQARPVGRRGARNIDVAYYYGAQLDICYILFSCLLQVSRLTHTPLPVGVTLCEGCDGLLTGSDLERYDAGVFEQSTAAFHCHALSMYWVAIVFVQEPLPVACPGIPLNEPLVNSGW